MLTKLEAENEKSIKAFQADLSQYYTGRPTPSLLDRVRIKYYDQLVPLETVAEISVPNPDMLAVRPWDQSLVKTIERAIHAANIGLSPQADSEMIKVYLPRRTKESDQKIFQLIKKRAEEAKVAIRLNRKRTRDNLDKDDRKENDSRIQELTDEATKRIDGILANKKEQMRV